MTSTQNVEVLSFATFVTRLVISRQRAWGVPLPIFYAEDGTPIMTVETIEHVAQLLKSMVQIICGNAHAKDPARDHPSRSSLNGEFKKELTSRTFGLTPGLHHGMGLLTVQELKYPADLLPRRFQTNTGWVQLIF